MQSSPSTSWQDVEDQESLAQLAAHAALACEWQQAIQINEKILKSNHDNVEALNRLARAQVCTGEITKAQKTYKKVLEIDPYNIIANKNLNKISATNGQNTSKNVVFSQNITKLFLSEPGKTKTANLLNLAAPSILAVLNYGEEINLITKSHSVTVTTAEGVYLGALPDDLAHRLIAFISGGNKYEAYVKSVTPKSLTIFIREVERSDKFINQPSFQTNQITYFENEE